MSREGITPAQLLSPSALLPNAKFAPSAGNLLCVVSLLRGVLCAVVLMDYKLVEKLSIMQVVEIKEAFAVFDREGLGCIGSTELERVLESLGHKPDKEELKVRELDSFVTMTILSHDVRLGVGYTHDPVPS